MTTKTELNKDSDLIIEWFSKEYCCDGSTVTNPAGGTATIADPVGYPVKQVSGVWTLLLATDESNAEGVIVHGDPISALAASTATTSKYIIAKRPPITLNQDLLPSADCRGTSFTVATLKTRLKALGYQLRSNPTKVTTQTE